MTTSNVTSLHEEQSESVPAMLAKYSLAAEYGTDDDLVSLITLLKSGLFKNWVTAMDDSFKHPALTRRSSKYKT